MPTNPTTQARAYITAWEAKQAHLNATDRGDVEPDDVRIMRGLLDVCAEVQVVSNRLSWSPKTRMYSENLNEILGATYNA